MGGEKEGWGRKALGIGRERKGREGRQEVWRNGKGEGR